jgi:uncharacterized protein (TIGR03437 family)
VISTGGVVSSSTLAAQTPLAPGALVTIFGSRLAEGSANAPTVPLGTQLAGASVLVAGRLLPLIATSDGKVDAALPFDLPVNTRLQLLVSRNTQISVPEEILVAPAQPGVFTVAGSGSGQGRIYVLGADSTQALAHSAAPAKPGDSLMIVCSGLGAVDQRIPDGSATPAGPAINTVNPASLSIGGVSATVSFAGLTPGLVGMYSVMATVPEGVPSGGAVPVILTVAGQSSPPVTMAIR